MSENLKVLCPRCDSRLTEKARRLRSRDTAHCPRCGDIDLSEADRRKLRRALRRADAAVDAGEEPKTTVKL